MEDPTSEADIQIAVAQKKHEFNVVLVVAALCVAWGLTVHVDSGVSACSLTTMQTDMNTTLTAMTTAVTMGEVAKCGSAIALIAITTDGAHQGLLVAAGILVFGLGNVIIGVARSAIQIAAGFILIGVGIGILNVLTASILDYFIRRHKQLVTFYLGVIYVGAGIGAGTGFIICGSTIDVTWRWNYLMPAIVTAPVLLFIIVTDRRALISRRVWHNAEAQQYIFPNDSGNLNRDEAPAENFGAKEVPSPEPKPKQPEKSEARRSHVPFRVTVMLLKRLFRNPPLMFTYGTTIFIMFYITAFVSLIPSFVQRHLHQSKETASYVLGATIPVICASTVLGGWIVQRWKFSYPTQLKYCFVLCAAAVPMCGVFFVNSVAVFAVLLGVGMIVVYANTSPTITLLPLAVRHGLALEEVNSTRNSSVASSEASLLIFSPSTFEAADDAMSRRPDLLVAYANILGGFLIRSVGSIPGPILLATLIDDNTMGSMPGAFALVGGVGTTLAAVFAGVAWWLGPNRNDPLVSADHMEVGN